MPAREGNNALPWRADLVHLQCTDDKLFGSEQVAVKVPDRIRSNRTMGGGIEIQLFSLDRKTSAVLPGQYQTLALPRDGSLQFLGGWQVRLSIKSLSLALCLGTYGKQQQVRIQRICKLAAGGKCRHARLILACTELI